MKERGSNTTGICELCGFRGSKAAMTGHLKACINEHSDQKGVNAHLYRIRVEGKELPAYWMDVEVKSQAKLADLDQFLRRTWLECCGHLSMFTINRMEYSVSPDPLDFPGAQRQRSMNVRIIEVLGQGMKFEYEYDFGSTTELRMRVIGSREVIADRRLVRLLARNEAPVWPCTTCQNPATQVCAVCLYDGNCFYCDKHTENHDCEDAWLPVVNSPRTGVCGYTGPIG